MIIPNTDRVLIRPMKMSDMGANIILPGQLKAGENLFFGEVIHAGSTKFKAGQKVYYSEYSAAAIKDVGAVVKGEKTMGDVSKEEAILFVVAEDDIMAYEE